MKKLRVLMWILILIMLGIIFGFSCQTSDDSVALSKAVAQEQQNITSKITDGEKTKVDDFIYKHIRSMAHCILYFCLSILIFIQCRLYGIKPLRALLLSVFCCFLYGMTDEFHQIFTDGRTSCMADVGKDTFGAFTGSALSLVFEKAFKFFKGVRK